MRRLFARRGAAAAPARPRPAVKPPDEDRFTEADIVAILRAGSQGTPAEELCASEGIPLKVYESWKAKYGGLSSSQIKVRRRRERTSRKTTLTLAGFVVVASGGWYAFSGHGSLVAPARKAQSAPAGQARGAAGQPAATADRAAAAQPVSAPAKTTAPAPAAGVTAGSVPAVSAPAASAPVASAAAASAPGGRPALRIPPDAAPAPPAETKASSVSTKPRDVDGAELHGYSVQVAAVPTPEEARALLVELTRGGYPAYVTRTTVGGTLLYRVRVGPFESLDATKAIAQHLEQEGHRGAWIPAK
jgi:SPOR domain/Transposase